MKKLLMVTTAIAGVAFMSAPASAAIDLDVGGYFRGYAVDTDIDSMNNRYDTDFRRDSELHVSGETTLDNGLTVGAHTEVKIANDQEADSVEADEVYAYFSSGFGRVNLGVEDGAAYLLQVEAPSADANVDGMSVSIEGIQDGSSTLYSQILGGIEAFRQDKLQYAQTDFSESDRLTYMTPKFNGFQAGISYTPRPETASDTGINNVTDNDEGGLYSTVGANVSAASYKDPIELSARYDGEYQGFGFAVGAGYSTADLEKKTVESLILTDIDSTGVASGTTLGATATDGFWMRDGVDTYNVGANVMFQNFSLGGSYMEAKTELGTDVNVADGTFTLGTGDLTRTTYVIGGAYDNGPYHVGVSYLKQETEQDAIVAAAAANSLKGYTEEADKLTVGGGYSFGPGMTFRGAVAWGTREVGSITADATALRDPLSLKAASTDFTQITVGTDIKF